MDSTDKDRQAHRVRQHLRGAIALTVAQAGSRLLSFLTLIVVQKNVPVAENGLFQLALRLSFLLALFTEFGIRGYLVREVARHRDDPKTAQAIFDNVFNLRLFLIGPVWVLGIALLWLSGYEKGVLVATSVFYVFTVLDSFAIFFKYLLRAYERMEFDAIFSILGRAVILGGLVILWHIHLLRVTTIGAVHIASAGLEAFLLALCIGHFIGVRLRLRWDSEGIFHALQRSIPFAVINIIGTLYMSTGTIALSKLLGEEAVGYYNAASRLPEALQFLPVAVVNALIPFLSRHHGDKELVRRYYNFLMRYLGYLAVVIGSVFLLAPEWVIHVVAREEYLVATTVFRFYGVWLILVYFQIVSANILICLDAEKIVMLRAFVALLLNVVLNIVGIQVWGLNGAAAALVITESVSAALYFVALARRGIPTLGSTVLRILAVGGVTAAGMWGFSFFAGDTLRIACGIVLGGALAVALIWRDDREFLRKLLKRH